MQEREMTKKDKAKEKRLKKKYDDSDMKASMKKQYGDDWKNVYYATIRKKAMEDIKENTYEAIKEGYQVLPNIDKERYTPIQGMEGPFMTVSGKALYYDPQEGSYYDRDTDMFLTYDEFKQYDEDPNRDMRSQAESIFKNLRVKAEGVKDDEFDPRRVKANVMKHLVDMYNDAKKDDGYSSEKMHFALGNLLHDMDMAGYMNSDYFDIEGLFHKGIAKKQDYKVNMGMLKKAYAQAKNLSDDTTVDPEIFTRGGSAMKHVATEGHSPHKKGTKKYKAHMAAKHASMAEGVKRNAIYQQVGKMLAKGHSMDAIKKRFDDLDKANPGYLEKIAQALKDRNEIPQGKYQRIKGAVESVAEAKKPKHKVTVEQMREALSIDDDTSDEEIVASYVRTMLDESMDTWSKVFEEVQFVLSILKEGKSLNPNSVHKILMQRHMQEYFDDTMNIKENVDTLRKIVNDKQYQTVKFSDGSMKIDLTTASLFLSVFDKQRPEIQEKIKNKIATKQGFLTMLDLIYGKM